MYPILSLLRELKSANLGHEAVIEIMLAALGLMIAVLTLISALLAAGIAVVSWFGYTSIRDEAAKRAEHAAAKTARTIASKVARERVARVFKEAEASALTTAQAEEKSIRKPGKLEAGGQTRQKAYTDKNLRKEDL